MNTQPEATMIEIIDKEDNIAGNEVVGYGGEIRPLVPLNIEQCKAVAEQIFKSGMYQPGTEDFTDERKKGMLVVAMMKAMSIGKDPSWALEFIYVINNKPTLFGDGPLTLANESGLIEYFEETPAKEGEDNPTATCILKRKDRDKIYKFSFTKKMAERAKLWGKPGPWTKYPDRMLQLRARARLLRDAVPEALGGFQVREEQDIESEKPPVDLDALEDAKEIEIKKIEALNEPDQADKNDSEQGVIKET